MNERARAADDFDFIRSRLGEIKVEEGERKMDILKRGQTVTGTRYWRYFAVTQKGRDTLGNPRDWWSSDYDANYRAKTPDVVIVEGADLAEGEEWQRFTPDGVEYSI